MSPKDPGWIFGDRLRKDQTLAKTQSTQRERRPMTENEIGKRIVDGAVQVHRELGPGLLETVYEVILAHELRRQVLQVERQVPVTVEYRESGTRKAFEQTSSSKTRSLLNSSVLKGSPTPTKSS